MCPKIVLINPPSSPLVNPKQNMPIGLASLASYLQKEGYSVAIKDLVESLHIDGIEEAEFYGIGFTSSQREEVKKIVNYLRQHAPSSKIVGGGIDCTVASSVTAGLFDFIVQGEGEIALTNLFKAGKRAKAKYWKAELADLSDFPVPAYEMLEGYDQIVVQTWRGCPFNCAFCAQRAMWKGKVRYFPLSYVRALAKNLAGKRVALIDEIATLQPNRLKKIARVFSKSQISWWCETRADMTISLQYMQMLKDYGCTEVALGIESGSQRILDAMNKKIKLEDIYRGIEHVKEAGMQLRTYIIRGFPGETEDDWERTLNFLRWAQPDTVRVYRFVPVPGCDVWKYPEKYNCDQSSEEEWCSDGETAFQNETIMQSLRDGG